VGKRAALKKFMDSQTLKELGDVFLKISQMEDIIKSGERVITNLYGDVPSESLNVLRYKKFATKVVFQELDDFLSLWASSCHY
jgi:hypothetical protein